MKTRFTKLQGIITVLIKDIPTVQKLMGNILAQAKTLIGQRLAGQC